MGLSNLYTFTKEPHKEFVRMLASGKNVRIKHIVSAGEITPLGEWYDQEEEEWIALIQGEALLVYENGEHVRLKSGDTLLIPSHQKHRVAFTSTTPPCIWIAVFYHN